MLKHLIGKEIQINAQNNEVVIAKKGNTPLHMAAIIDDSDVMKELLANKANPHLVNKLGNTPILEAASFSTLETFNLISKATTSLQARKGLLHMAVMNPCIEVFDKVKSEEGTAAASAPFPRKPFHLPIFFALANQARTEVLKYLVEHGPVNVENEAGDIPLSMAIKNSNTEAIKLFLAAGADKHKKNKFSISPVNIAEASTDPLVRSLILT